MKVYALSVVIKDCMNDVMELEDRLAPNVSLHRTVGGAQARAQEEADEWWDSTEHEAPPQLAWENDEHLKSENIPTTWSASLPAHGVHYQIVEVEVYE